MPNKRVVRRNQLKPLPPLRSVLAYRNDAVLHKFRESFRVSLSEARELFTEVKRFLWLCAKNVRDGGEAVTVFKSMRMLDEMWHTFVLFTPEYHAFCDHFFGFYLHHMPTTKAEKDRMRRERKADPAAFMREYERKLDEHYSRVYDELGRKTLEKWHREFASKYDSKFIASHAVLA